MTNDKKNVVFLLLSGKLLVADLSAHFIRQNSGATVLRPPSSEAVA